MAHIAVIDANRAGLRLLERALALGHEVTFVRTDRHNLYGSGEDARNLVNRMRRVLTIDDTASSECVAAALAPIHQANPIKAVLCVNEYAIQGATGAARKLGIPATSADMVNLAIDKFALRQRVAAEGLECGRSILVNGRPALAEAMEDVGYPVMVKCARSADSLMAQAVMRPSERDAALERLDAEWKTLSAPIRAWLSQDFVCETFFEGPLVSAEFITGVSGTSPLVVSQRIQAKHDPTIELGTILPAPISDSDTAECLDYAMAVARAAGGDRGAFHVELILTEEGPRLVELNPRLMGGSMPLLYDFLTGQHVHDLLIDLHLGLPVKTPFLPPDRQVFSLRLEAAEAGKVTALPKPEELPLHGMQLHRYEQLCQVGDSVQEENILGRLYFGLHRSVATGPHIARLLDHCEARFGVSLMR